MGKFQLTLFRAREILNICLNPIKRKLCQVSLPNKHSRIVVITIKQWAQFRIYLQLLRIKLARWLLWGMDFYIIGGIPERIPKGIKKKPSRIKRPIPIYSIMQPLVRPITRRKYDS